MDTETSRLVEKRGSEYGQAHYLAGLVIGVLEEPFTKMVITHPELVHDWVLMLSKLIRILFSPTKIDHYDDIMGYALLAKRTLEGASNDPIQTGSATRHEP